MSSDFKKASLALAITVALGAAMDYSMLAQAAPAELRVCADPNNLPFSDARGAGFENRLAMLVAQDLGRHVHYTWFPQRRGFIRNTLRAGSCDVVMGIPAQFDLARPTLPYYHSTYVFVTRRDRGLHLSSFDDPRLKQLRIGLHVIGDDYNNPPPAQALAMRGIVSNVRGYMIYGEYSKPSPPKALIDAVAKGDIDVAIAWGPLAGYFAQHEPVPLEVLPAESQRNVLLPMAFDISMGVRRDDAQLKTVLEGVITRRLHDIQKILEAYGVPLLAFSAAYAAVPAPAKPAPPAAAPAGEHVARAPVGPIPGGGKPPDIVNPYANDATALQAGRRFFTQMNCAGCHGEHAGGGMGPSLRDAMWLYGHSSGQIFDSISQGRAHGMPAWGTRLPPDAIWLMVAYIQSLRTPREPQPPDQ